MQLERTWEAARVFRPAGPVPERGVPVVLYAHGCAGLDDDLTRWAELLTARGYAVIAPDHQARLGGATACRAGPLYGPDAVSTFVSRDAELRYALRQVRTLPWVRQQAVFLLGFDHGGVLAAGYTGPPFAGYIVTGWTCTSPYPRGRLATAPDRPVLAIRWERDPWFADAAWNGDCEASLAGRPASRSIVLEGTGHSVAGDARARQAVVDFLRAHTVR